MEFIQQIISKDVVYALGWTMIHSLWQAIGVGLLLALAMLVLQKYTARTRYILSNISLFGVLFLAVLTFFSLYNSRGGAAEEEITLVAGQTLMAMDPDKSFIQGFYQQFVHYFNDHLPLIVMIWLVGVAFFLLRLIGGLAYIQHLKNRHVFPLPTVWMDKLETLKNKIPVKKQIALLESALVKAPMVVGYFKPVILMPVGAVNGLTSEQVEAILAHELAHIFRNDYLLNILQSLVEVLFYFNPAVWWISANIRTERENCCDDIAVELCGNSLTYAKALVHLQELNQGAPNMAMAFSGRKNQMLNRVKRILNLPQNKSNIMEKFTATCMLLIAVVMLSISANRPHDNQTETYRYDDLKEAVELKLSTEALIEDNRVHEVVEVTLSASQDTNEEEAYWENKPLIHAFFPPLDTLPKGKIRLEVTNDGKKIDARIREGKITYLEIDGKEIPEGDYAEYEGMLEEIIEDIPEPPAPPAPPAPPIPGNPDLPSPPPAPPVPPAPPIPPVPSEEFYFNNSKTKTITREKDENGNSVLRIEADGDGEVIELKVTEEGNVYLLDGEELEDGEKYVIIEQNSPRIFSFDGGDFAFALPDSNFNFNYTAPEINVNIPMDLDWMTGNHQFNQEKFNEWLGENHDLNFSFDYNQLLDGQMDLMKELADGSKNFNWSFNDGNIHYLGNEGYFDRSIQQDFEALMQSEGILDNTTIYKLELSKKELKINGKKQSPAIHEKFIEAYEGLTNGELKNKSKIIINKNAREE